MTESERIEWGKAEHTARLADLAAVKDGLMSLEFAQKVARLRARKSGMTPRQAHKALVDGQRTLR